MKPSSGREMKQYDFNDILPLVGEYGWYQSRLQLIFILLVISPMHQLVLIYFLSGHTQWECKTNSTMCIFQGSLTTENEMLCKIPANEWRYLDNGDSSIEKKFNLYCDDNWKVHFSSSVFWIGYVIGIPLFGRFSDHYGRKSTIASSVALMNIFGLALTFAPNIELFCFLRFLSGLFIPGHIQMFILLQEVVGNQKRNLAGMLFWISVQLSAVILTVTAYYIRDWQIFNILSTAPYILLGAFHVMIPESPRWYLLHGKFKEAKLVVQKISKGNSKVITENFQFKRVNQTKRFSWLEIFHSKKYFIHMIALSFCWFTGCLGYYGMTLASSDLPGSKYVNFILVNIIEVPAMIISTYVGDRVGRKYTAAPNLIIGGALSVGTAFMPSSGTLGTVRLTMSVAGKLFMTIAYLMLWTWSAEIYPTNLRIVGVGVNQLASKIGCVIMPWVSKYLINFYKPLPFLVMGVLAVLGGIIACFLPETKGMDLNESSITTNKSNNSNNNNNSCDIPQEKGISKDIKNVAKVHVHFVSEP